MLDKNADKALEGAEDGAVQHDRRAARAVLGDVLRIETPGHGKIHLHGAELPDSPDAVL